MLLDSLDPIIPESAAIRRVFFSAQTAGQAHHLKGNIWCFSGKAGKQHRPYLPSGKLSHNYGKSPFLMGKSTINGHFQ
jgi:hypothetical protein